MSQLKRWFIAILIWSAFEASLAEINYQMNGSDAHEEVIQFRNIPLHQAALHGNAERVKELLKYGGYVHARNVNNQLLMR